MAFWRIAMRPGKPMMHGTAGRDAGDRPARQSRLLLCLRLPVSGAVDSRAVGPRRPSITSRETRRCSGRDLAANDQREDYLRARLEERADGALIATPVNHQDCRCLGISLRHGHL